MSLNILLLFPDHLNLNGDAGNALVLQRRLEWRGFTAEIKPLHLGDDLPETPADFVLLGHGSAAAWAQIEDSLLAIWPTLCEWFEAGCCGLAVNSGAELLHRLPREDGQPYFAKALQRGKRVSRFEASTGSGFAAAEAVIGYRNSELDLPGFELQGNLVATALHGPVLAKNPWLCDWFIKQMVGERAFVAAEPKGALALADQLSVAVRAHNREQANHK